MSGPQTRAKAASQPKAPEKELSPVEYLLDKYKELEILHRELEQNSKSAIMGLERQISILTDRISALEDDESDDEGPKEVDKPPAGAPATAAPLDPSRVSGSATAPPGPSAAPVAHGIPAGIPGPVISEGMNNISDIIQRGLASELTKKALAFPEAARLRGVSNYEQWLQALKIVLKAYGLEGLVGSSGGFDMLNPQI